MTLKSLTPFVFLLLILQSCTPEEPEVDPSEVGSMTCTLNGDAWSAISFNNTLLHITDEEPTGKRLDLRGNGMGIQIILTCAITSSNVGNEMPIETYSTYSSFEALVTIMEGWSILGMSTGIDEDIATISITSIDGATKTCSGTFSFKTSDLATDEINYEAEEGVFTDLVYIVQ